MFMTGVLCTVYGAQVYFYSLDQRGGPDEKFPRKHVLETIFFQILKEAGSMN